MHTHFNTNQSKGVTIHILLGAKRSPALTGKGSLISSPSWIQSSMGSASWKGGRMGSTMLPFPTHQISTSVVSSPVGVGLGVEDGEVDEVPAGDALEQAHWTP